jgi:RNA polymerase sigma-70 factor (ECF subfamily)
VQSALAVLSAEHRAILVLREMEEFDYGQIAVALAIPVGTVRSRLHRARLAFRETLIARAANRSVGVNSKCAAR